MAPANVRAPLLSTSTLDMAKVGQRNERGGTARGDFRLSLFFVDHLRASDGASAEAGVVAHGMEPVASFESVRGPWEELDPPISAARPPFRGLPSPILGAA